MQAIADLRARFDSLAAVVNRTESTTASNPERAPANEPEDVARRLQFDALAPLPELQPVGVISDSETPNWDYMLDELHSNLYNQRLKERDRAEIKTLLIFRKCINHLNSIEQAHYYSRVRLLYVVVTHDWRIALSDAKFQKSRSAQISIDPSALAASSRAAPHSRPRYAAVTAPAASGASGRGPARRRGRR